MKADCLYFGLLSLHSSKFQELEHKTKFKNKNKKNLLYKFKKQLVQDTKNTYTSS